MPDTKNIVEIMYPLAGSSSLRIMRLYFHMHFFPRSPHAQGGAENEGYRQGTSYHCEEMLESQKETHVPRGDIVNFVRNVQLFVSFFFLY